MVGFDDLKGLFQLKRFCDSMILLDYGCFSSEQFQEAEVSPESSVAAGWV